MKVNVQYAETHLADLASAVDSGEEVEITRPDKPALRLVVSTPAEPSKPKGPRILGALRGKIIVPSEEEWRAADKELERLMNDGPVFPGDPR
jgi:antitoxin (DNA-binding transcriptional repressor) of toxin-antitoxin stability system